MPRDLRNPRKRSGKCRETQRNLRKRSDKYLETQRNLRKRHGKCCETSATCANATENATRPAQPAPTPRQIVRNKERPGTDGSRPLLTNGNFRRHDPHSAYTLHMQGAREDCTFFQDSVGFRLANLRVRAGTILCRSPTKPRSATEKIGANLSLLTAMM